MMVVIAAADVFQQDSGDGTYYLENSNGERSDVYADDSEDFEDTGDEDEGMDSQDTM